MTLPHYVNCKEKEIVHCDYLLTGDRPSTCAYAIDIGGIGVGATIKPLELEGIVGSQKESRVKDI